jgi:glucose/arabinose dehydrogenase
MRLLALLCTLLSVGACARAADAPVAPVTAAADALQVQQVAQGLEQPWGLAFLPDGRMLITEKAGTLRLVDAQGKVSAPLAGVPKVVVRGQGGLLDVAVDPQFARTQRIYLSYSEPRGGDANATAVAHARLDGNALKDVTVIFRQQPARDSGHHFGSRLVFAPDGALFVTLGDRNSARDQVQPLDTTIGKVVRIDRDGGIPEGNPFVTREGALPEVWSYGHRNLQGAAWNPADGQLWTHEHGPKGGDEINIARPGRNYGWPAITYGREYSGLKVGEGISAKTGMEQPLHWWLPSIAPSGMAFYTAERFPQWRGQLFVGSLKFGQLVQLQLDGERVVRETRHEMKARIRDVRQGPDGYLYLLTDAADGRLLRVAPAEG